MLNRSQITSGEGGAENSYRRFKPDQNGKKSTRNLHVDEVVLILEDNAPRGHWPLGRVIEVIAGKDGVIRAARVKSADGKVYDRPVVKLFILETPTYSVRPNLASFSFDSTLYFLFFTSFSSPLSYCLTV